MRLHFLLIAAACSIFLAIPGHAEIRSISGSDVPEFTVAVESWLNGDDLEALEALAALSRDGNPAAQILLAGIATRGHFHTHVTSQLERTERVALLRVPGGLSGKSWLTIAENTEPLATALLQVTRIGEKAAAISALISFGETGEALLAAQSMLYQGEATALIEVLQGMDAELTPEADVLLLWALFQSESEDSGRYVGSARIASRVFGNDSLELSEMAWVAPTPVEILEDTERRNDVIRLSDQVISWTPLNRYCDQHCPSSAGSCKAVGASLLSAVGPFAMRSPRMSIISNERYWNSSRAEADLARNIVDLSRYQEDTFDSVDACFMDAMSEMQAEHGYRQ
ncbi:hypothetical protein [Yoonia algicola]|uniref:HEAT repeat domain-containing protein n=1 Tax=Yoonia algicola TaxID=3137368 RepID=A0AAN0M1I5_9RHOB